MNTKLTKNILAISVALAVNSAYAQSSDQISIYGTISPSVEFVDTDANNANSTSNITSNDSFFGIRGDEKLSSDLNVFFDVQMGVNFAGNDVNQGNDDTYLRNAYVGINAMGTTVKIGQFETPFRQLGERVDPFVGKRGTSSNILGNFGYATGAFSPETSDLTTNDLTDLGYFNRRQGSQFGITSPVFYGAQASFSVAGGQSSNNNNLSDADSNLMSASLTYSYGNFDFGYGYERQSDLGITNLDGVANRLTGVYKATPDLKFMATAERLESPLLATDTTVTARNAYSIAANYTIMGPHSVQGAVTRANETATDANDGAQQLSLGYTYQLSKRTSASATYTYLDNDEGQNARAYGFARDGLLLNGAERQSSLGFALNHTF